MHTNTQRPLSATNRFDFTCGTAKCEVYATQVWVRERARAGATKSCNELCKASKNARITTYEFSGNRQRPITNTPSMRLMASASALEPLLTKIVANLLVRVMKVADVVWANWVFFIYVRSFVRSHARSPAFLATIFAATNTVSSSFATLCAPIRPPLCALLTTNNQHLKTVFQRRSAHMPAVGRSV